MSIQIIPFKFTL